MYNVLQSLAKKKKCVNAFEFIFWYCHSLCAITTTVVFYYESKYKIYVVKWKKKKGTKSPS